MFALAWSSPGVDIESLSSHQPPLPNFFWTSWDERKLLAFTLLAFGIELFLGDYVIMCSEAMATKTFRMRPNPKTVICSCFTFPSDVNTTGFSLLGMFELPGQHFPGTNRWSNLLDALHDGLLILCLAHHLFIFNLFFFFLCF